MALFMIDLDIFKEGAYYEMERNSYYWLNPR